MTSANRFHLRDLLRGSIAGILTLCAACALLALLALPRSGAAAAKTKRAAQPSSRSATARSTSVRNGKPKHRPASAPRRRSASRDGRCKGVFCTAQRLDVSAGSDPTRPALSDEAVQQLMAAQSPRLQVCMIDARRRDPELDEARVEFAVDPAGRVLAARVNNTQRTRLARCVANKLRGARLSEKPGQRTVASFTLRVQ